MCIAGQTDGGVAAASPGVQRRAGSRSKPSATIAGQTGSLVTRTTRRQSRPVFLPRSHPGRPIAASMSVALITGATSLSPRYPVINGLVAAGKVAPSSHAPTDLLALGLPPGIFRLDFRCAGRGGIRAHAGMIRNSSPQTLAPILKLLVIGRGFFFFFCPPQPPRGGGGAPPPLRGGPEYGPCFFGAARHQNQVALNQTQF